MGNSLKKVVAVLLVFALAIPTLLYLYQEQMLYHPRPYPETYLDKVRSHLNDRFVILKFRTSAGLQQAYYVSAKQGDTRQPKNIWVNFAGNASLALSWLSFVDSFPSDEAGFLLVDYPGYGANEGKPSPEAMRENAIAAFESLGDFLGWEESQLRAKSGALGFSLGAAAALDFAVKKRIPKVVLVAPFTSTLEMAEDRYGSVLSRLLRHRFDNQANLQTLATQTPTPAVALFHSANDDVIPVDMGRRLAQRFPALIEYQELSGANHNQTLDAAQSLIYASMLKP